MRRIVCLGALGMLVLAAGGAFAADGSGMYLLRRGADTLAFERFTRTPGRLEAELLFRTVGGRWNYSITLARDAAPIRMEYEFRRAADPITSPPAQSATLDFVGDSVFASVSGGAIQRIGTRRGAVPYANPSVAMMEQILLRARALGGSPVTVPLFAVGGAMTLDAVVTKFRADSVCIHLGETDICFLVDAAGNVKSGAIPSQGVTIERTASADAAAFAVEKADYSAPPGAPYTAEEVAVPTGRGFTLAGTLTLPKQATGLLPAVVTITGSGLEDRDESLPIVRGYRPFRQLADTLARRGIAVLRLDDRGYGGSGGNGMAATTVDFADDIRSAIEFLRARKGIDGNRLALVGHSEGGLIAPMVAEKDPLLKGIVLMAGPSRNGRKILEYQNEQAIEAMHPNAKGAARDSLRRLAMAQMDSLGRLNPWTAFFLAYEPLETVRKVKTPVLIVQGATDRQVTADQAVELESAFRAAGNRDVTRKTFADANHLFLLDPSGAPAGYNALPDHQVRRDVLGTVVDWLAQRLK